MPLLNSDNPSKNRIAYLGALTLLFSYAELFIPRIFPFFKLGLSNVPVLMGLELSPWSFFLLVLIKSFCSSMMAGTLFSPFFIITVVQSIGSAFVMYILFRLKLKNRKIYSLYGISVAGSALSTLLQVLCCELYLGEGTKTILGPMLLFSLAAGIVTAFLVYALELPEQTPQIKTEIGTEHETNGCLFRLMNKNPLVTILLVLIAAIAIFMQKDWYVLLPVMFVCLGLQFLSGRRIMIVPYIFLWLFIIISCVLIPQGQVLFEICNIKITKGALNEGLTKAMILTSVSALSQSMAQIRFAKDGSLIAGVLEYYQCLQRRYKKSSGNLIARLKETLGDVEL